MTIGVLRQVAAVFVLATCATAAAACPPIGLDQKDARLLRAAFAPGDPLSTALMARALDTIDDEAAAADILAARNALHAQVRDAAAPDPMIDLVEFAGTSDSPRKALLRSRLDAAADQNGHLALWLMDGESPEQAAAWMARAARAPHYRALYNSALRSLIARLRAGDAELSEVEAFEISSAIGVSILPPYAPVTGVCKEATGKLRRDCHAFASRMLADADTLIDGAIATVLLEWAAPDATSAAAARVTRRQWRWVLAQSATLQQANEIDATAKRRYVSSHLARGELFAIHEAMSANGVPAEPPADWKDDLPPMRDDFAR